MKNIWIVGVVVVVLGVLLFTTSSKQKQGAETLDFVPGTSVACLPSGHQNLALHIHPTISILVDGVAEVVPANIGITEECMAELHTHDASGVIHLETATAGRFNQLAFKDFFAVWGMPVEREGYTLAITVNGTPVSSIDEVPLEDKAAVQFTYTSTEGAL